MMTTETATAVYAGVTGRADHHNLGALSAVLFCTSLRAQDEPNDETVRTAVGDLLATRVADDFYPLVGQVAGDYPDLYLTRITWCRRAVRAAFAAATSPAR
ncbi:hypothetical protein [Streptomyces sp. NPDC002952]|uniref:hypothetical protein n=1 Tax=Streptomyces sp. NPDC002952 TaxID=3364673 RepID=UPI00367A64D7